MMFDGAFHKKNIHFFILLACALMQMLSLSEAYRTFAYLNILIVLFSFYKQFKAREYLADYGWITRLALFIGALFSLHFIAVQDVVIVKEMRHLLVAAFLVIGIYMLDADREGYVRKYAFHWVLVSVLLYLLLQIITLSLFDRPYGTAKNPHYLALFSSISLVVVLYGLFRVPTVMLKSLMALCVVVAGGLLIHSWSRPTWIGLVLAGFLVACLLTSRRRFYLLAVMAIVLSVLTVTDMGGFTTRSSDLIENLKTEERVTIWQETWQMQSESSELQWLVGHGIDSFEDAFKPYSSHYKAGTEFNSPHNYVLELLFVSGGLGLSLMLVLFYGLYGTLVKAITARDERENIYMVLIAVLTASMVLTSLTLPFFSSYSMNVIAIIIGVLLYFRKRDVSINA